MVVKSKRESASEEAGRAGVVKAGFDFGTNISVIKAMEGDRELDIKPDIIFTVVGYPKPGILPGILPRGKTVLFGEDAMKFRVHLNLRWPLNKGCVNDAEAAKDFIAHLRSLIDPEGTKEIWAVVGCPANAPTDKLSDHRLAVARAFKKMLIVPEPFLTALGAREEARLEDPTYIDPIRNSLIVDIGAGTTDLCMVHGYYPGPDEQVSIARAGNDIDVLLYNAIRRKYPDCDLSSVSVTRVKEQNSFVGEPKGEVLVNLPVGGKPRQLELTDEIRGACESLIPDIVSNIAKLVTRCNPDAVEVMQGNILLTGGGSLIGNICEHLEQTLHAEGYTLAKVKRVDDYKRLVAKGALKTAMSIRDNQWQIPM
jgi:rod shape-determining protein MreB